MKNRDLAKPAGSSQGGVSAISDKRTVTIKDVALASGVSIATVSYALNNSRAVGETVRERVFKAAQDLGYSPNRLATGLLTRRTHVIGVAAQGYDWGDLWQILAGIDAVSQEHGYKMLLASGSDEPGRPIAVVKDFLARRVDALISLATQTNDRQELIQAIEETGIPFAMAFHSNARALMADSVMPDHIQGAYLATRYLLSLGRRRIAFAGGPFTRAASQLRLQGYQQAHREGGLEPDPKRILFDEFSVQGGIRAGNAFFQDCRKYPDAVFAADDPIAAGILRSARAAGLRVPEDVAVVGFNNDLPLCDACDPPLTSVAMPLNEVGSICMHRLVERLRSPERWVPQAIALPCTLITRQSA